MPTSTPLIAFSIDYDGCADGLLKKGPHFALPVVAAVGDEIASSLLDFLLDRASVAEKPEDVIVFCGSNRQSARIDAYLDLENKNGKAFEQLLRFAQAYQWTYDPTILANEHDEVIIPSSAGLQRINICDLSPRGPDIKVCLLQKQVDHLSNLARMQGKSAHMSFFDDDMHVNIFKRISDAYDARELVIPANITLHLFKHHWIENFNHYYIPLTQGHAGNLPPPGKAPLFIRSLTSNQALSMVEESISASAAPVTFFSAGSAKNRERSMSLAEAVHDGTQPAVPTRVI